MTRRHATALVAALLTTLLAGCVSLPEAGPVVVTPPQDAPVRGTDAFFLPNPPQPGESPTEIVAHFLEAMRANPVQTNVARQFLSSSARRSWNPERSTTIYDELSSPTLTTSADSTQVRIDLSGVKRLDERGMWSGAASPGATTERFPMVVEDGEWRIEQAPDALIVPTSWFATQFRQVSLYFFDPTGSILIPEPVFVPRGEQLATTLTRGLLRGPGANLDQVSRTYFPDDAQLELSVPVSVEGTADVSLQTNLDPVPEGAMNLMVAQLVWTLRQDPSIQAVRLSINGEPMSPPGSATAFRVSGAEEFSPTVEGASSRLFGLLGGRVVAADPGAAQPTAGPLGRRGARLRDLAVDLSGRWVAGVARSGRAVRFASLADAEGEAETVARGTDFLTPHWDFGRRIWLIDRTPAGAQVSFVAGGAREVIDVPGITGEDVTHALVSRDGSRLVAVIAGGEEGDLVRVSRIVHDTQGRVRRVTEAQQIAGGADDPLVVTHLAWHTATTVTVVHALGEVLTEIRPVPVDGATTPVEELSGADPLLREEVRHYAGSPVEGEAPLVQLVGRALRLDDAERVDVALDPRLSVVTYVG